MPANPTLDQNHRRTIGSNFMKTLCEKTDQAEKEGKECLFTIAELWKHLSAFGFVAIWPLPVHYFYTIGFITVNDKGKIAITREGKNHCNDSDDPEPYQNPIRLLRLILNYSVKFGGR
jgi:hypothetical protein